MYDPSAFEKHSVRAFICPDGVTRIVKLQGWFWSALHMLEHEYGYNPDEIVNSCYRVARDSIDLEHNFACALERSIFVLTQLIKADEGGLANQNY